MLKELRLVNIVLAESLSIPFSPSFNVLSGESGSGKSAIMNALNLIAGERSDSSCVRHGEEKGVVEAIFDCADIPQALAILTQAGIDHDPQEELFIRREVTASGKSRAFINNQLAQLALLRQVSSTLFEVVGQHANQKLLSLDYHRYLLDLFGSLEKELADFSSSWQEEVETKEKLHALISSEAQRLRSIEIFKREIEELEEASIKEGEEEELFAEYTQLSHAEELAQKAGDIINVLSGEKISTLGLLRKQKTTFEHLTRLAPKLKDIAASYENALLELQEVAHTLRMFESSIEHNPERVTFLEKRLELINRIKKKYGPSLEAVESYYTKTQEALKKLENSEADIEWLQKKLDALLLKNDEACLTLTSKRKAAAIELQRAVEHQLRSLNMPKVEFFIEIASQKRNKHGDDRIEFYLIPNLGEHRVPLRDCASGGELSRIMLALQTLLAGREKIPTLVFDEIDANIGGETASVVGEKLTEIASNHQVLCITHFPQVAKFAAHHLRISKKEVSGRTVTLVNLLDHASHQQELVRMIGGVSIH